jgi:cell division protein FtsB
VLLGCLAATAYFVHHAINGTYGLAASSRLIERSKVLERQIASLEAVRGRLQRDVVLLAAEPPNPDMVEELARSLLGFTRSGDLTLVEPDGESGRRAYARAEPAAR